MHYHLISLAPLLCFCFFFTINPS
ncbi:hypothetical protein NC651_027504 [Populus alba x Populus x berolinensis]|nr:hypothetical protein NC651_027504 [Populus alba x Populus x berolinensis]